MRRKRGFTLLETLVTLVIAGILLTVAIPELTDLIRYNRSVAAINSLVRAFNFARYNAISRDRYVTICRSNDGRQCSRDASWNDGWLIFVNLDRDYPAHVDTGESVLYTHGPMTTGNGIISNRSAFTFRPRGIYSTNGTLLYCSTGDIHDQALVINVMGRIRVEDASALTNGMSCTDQS